MTPDVSIIIVNYNTCRMTAECIESIYTHTTGITFEIILVDNASSDDSKEHFEKDNRITYIFNNDNIGFGRANNVGIAHANGRNILFLNSDTLLLDNSIKILSDYLDSNPKTGAVGANLIDWEHRPALSFQRLRPSIMWELNLLSLGILSRIIYGRNRTFNYNTKPLEVGYISGADMMTRKSILNQIGGFSPEFFMYYEETDLCNRISQAGYNLVITPDAQIIHLEGKSFNKNDGPNLSRIKIQEESREIYYRRNHSKTYHSIANIIYSINKVINPTILSLLGKKKASKTLIARRNALK